MFGIGGTELAIILIFGFLVLGPDKLPQIARFIGKAVRSFKEAQEKVTNVVQTEVYEPMKDVIDPIKSDIDSIKKPLGDMVQPLNEMVSPLQDLGKELKNPFASVVDGVKGPSVGENSPEVSVTTPDVIARSEAEPALREVAGKQSSETESVRKVKVSTKKKTTKKPTSTMSLKVPQLKKTKQAGK